MGQKERRRQEAEGVRRKVGERNTNLLFAGCRYCLSSTLTDSSLCSLVNSDIIVIFKFYGVI